MRIIKRVPASKKVRKSKLYSKSVRYGIADKSVARMYSDLEKEIFLIERRLENLKYKVKYYSFWDKIVSAFHNIKDKVAEFIKRLYDSVSKKIKSIFSVKVDKEYTVSSFINSDTNQFDMERFTKFVKYLFTFPSVQQPKNYAESASPKTLEELNNEITRAVEAAGENEERQAQVFDAISAAIGESLQSDLDIQTNEIKHQSDSIEQRIEKQLNKFIRTTQQVKILIFRGNVKSRFWLCVISFLLFLITLVIAYRFKVALVLLYIKYKIYFLIATVLFFALFCYSFVLLGMAVSKAKARADQYRQELVNRITALAKKIMALKEGNEKDEKEWELIRSSFAQNLESATSKIKESMEKYKSSWFRDGALKEEELDEIYEESFKDAEGYFKFVESINEQAEPEVSGKSRLRERNRLFNSNKRVIKKKLRYR